MIETPGSGATTFASGLARGRAGRGPTLRRRILLLLLPGLLCILLALGGVALVERLGSGDGAPDAAAPETCAPSPARPGPEIDLAIDPAGGRGAGWQPGSRVTYPDLERTRVRRLVTRAGQAGASTISTPALWRDLEQRSSGLYDWRLLDRVIDEARSQDMKVRLQVGTMPAFAFDADSLRPTSGRPGRWRPPLTDAELGRWSRFLDTLTRHVQGRVDYIEIWDEPNQQASWPTGPDPEAFARLLEASYGAITSVDPSITVISGGLRHNDVGFLQATYDAGEELFGASAPLFDQVGVHPFSGDRAPGVVSPERVVDRRLGEVDRNFLGVRSLHEVMRRHGGGASQVYVGAFGYSTRPRGRLAGVADETRADHLTEALETLTCAADVRALSWYAYYPSPTVDPSWTMLNRRGTPGETYRALVRWAERVGATG